MRHRFATAATVLDKRSLILVRVDSGPVTGWGEAAPFPGHTSESMADVWDALEDAVTRSVAGSNAGATGIAGAALAQAVDDVAARAAGLPLAEYLGACEQIWASAAIGLLPDGTPDREAVAGVAAAGYRHAKLKISPETDVASLAELVTEFDSLAFGLDANGSLRALPPSHLEALDDLHLGYLEQPGPFGDLEWHRSLRDNLSTPIALDESADTSDAVRQIIATGAADIINLKTGRFGTTASLALAREANSAGLSARVGGLIESGVGRAHAVALAGCPEFRIVGDIAASNLYFDNDLVYPHWELADGRLVPTSEPGIGVEVDEELVSGMAFWSFVAE